MKTTQFGINMGQCSWQACFKFHLYKQSSHITISSLCFLNLTSCTITIASVIMCCTEVCGYLVTSKNTIKSLHMDLLFIYFSVVCRCSVGTTVTITSVTMCCTGCNRDLRPPGNVFDHNEVSSYRSTDSYFWVVCRCSVGTTVTITSVIMCCIVQRSAVTW